ncbi:hypothetical protein PoHVEF18_006781 [Penicillium ochrochloron]
MAENPPPAGAPQRLGFPGRRPAVQNGAFWDCNRRGHRAGDAGCWVQQIRDQYEEEIARLMSEIARLQRSHVTQVFHFENATIAAPGAPVAALPAIHQPTVSRNEPGRRGYHPYRGPEGSRGRRRGHPLADSGPAGLVPAPTDPAPAGLVLVRSVAPSGALACPASSAWEDQEPIGRDRAMFEEIQTNTDIFPTEGGGDMDNDIGDGGQL